jgi:hypothetical protein
MKGYAPFLAHPVLKQYEKLRSKLARSTRGGGLSFTQNKRRAQGRPQFSIRYLPPTYLPVCQYGRSGAEILRTLID